MSAGSRGLTLIECAVGMAAAGAVTAAAGALLLTGLRAARGITATVESRRQLQVAASVLAAELAAISAEAGDLVAASESSVTLRALRGFGVTCAGPVGQRLVLDDSLLSLLRAVDPARDGVRFFAQGDPLRAADDHWAQASVSWAGPGSCASGSSGTALTLGGSAVSIAQTHEGAPVRLFELVQYRRYRDGAGQVMLGVRSPGPSGWSATSPVAGPLSAAGGLLFHVLDSAGGAALLPHDAALVIVTLRAAPPPGRSGDSLTFAVSVRGAPR